MKIDFHTHNPNSNHLCIESLSLLDTPGESYFTYGLHPWHLTQMNLSEFETRLLSLYKNEKFLALGEAGLDRACAIDYELQRQAFSFQLNLANELSIDVVIIHCVRALNDVIELVKKSSFKGTLVFHDANFSLEDSQRLMEGGHYLSFGTNLLRDNAKASQVFSKLNLEQIFLETDDLKQSIDEIYDQAATKLGISTLVLETQVLKNFQKLFPSISVDQ